ncbi:phage portal protein [Holdemania sp. 1001302B_160321_E10]|uniref:phage portal protein n=1 Tax=Holdemania sp. 1001302B_160321_E10 TaxID=2787120 RepID=UPI001896E01B|nr:phage portal protein [Holdemania sp. 1001302B_160321_E10]
MLKKKKKNIRAEPKNKRNSENGFYLCSSDAFETLTCSGYTSLAHNPEIISAVDTIARLIGSMTIHLMENKENGDVRVKNELSRKIDIDPNRNMTRMNFIVWIIRTMMIEGDGNAVVYPETRRGILKNLQPIPPAMAAFIPDGLWDYKVSINGDLYDPDDILHFVLNPGSYYPWKGEGYQIALSDVAQTLKQGTETQKGFMESKWKPSLIVKVDALTEEFAGKEGRRNLLDEYVNTGRAGEPWLIPAEQFSIEQVKPLTLSDLALSEMIQLDKKTVAGILGIPAFVLGVGEFKRDEWNNFISSRIMPLAKNIEQELTRKLLLNPDWFFRFNSRSLYNYDIRDLAEVADSQYERGIMTGNEARDWIGMSPREGLDELRILENYIPLSKVGDQSKLNGGE